MAWHGSVDVGSRVATCWDCQTSSRRIVARLGYWECPCELGNWALEHTHDSSECVVWASALVDNCNCGEGE